LERLLRLVELPQHVLGLSKSENRLPCSRMRATTDS
jgi:hypothetical protein